MQIAVLMGYLEKGDDGDVKVVPYLCLKKNVIYRNYNLIHILILLLVAVKSCKCGVYLRGEMISR